MMATNAMVSALSNELLAAGANLQRTYPEQMLLILGLERLARIMMNLI